MATGGTNILMMGFSSQGLPHLTSLRLEVRPEKMRTSWMEITTPAKKTSPILFLALRATYVPHRRSPLTTLVSPNAKGLVLFSMIGHRIVRLVKWNSALWVTAWFTLLWTSQNRLCSPNMTCGNTVMVSTAVEWKPSLAQSSYFCRHTLVNLFLFGIFGSWGWILGHNLIRPCYIQHIRENAFILPNVHKL